MATYYGISYGYIIHTMWVYTQSRFKGRRVKRCQYLSSVTQIELINYL